MLKIILSAIFSLLMASAFAQSAQPANPLRPAAPPAAAQTTPPETQKRVAAPKPKAETATPTEAAEKPKRQRSPAQLANDDRMRKCGAEWREAKAAGKTGTQTYVQYSTACRARLKAAGQ
jgi:outer membrane biosynthesis protein TonB